LEGRKLRKNRDRNLRRKLKTEAGTLEGRKLRKNCNRNPRPREAEGRSRNLGRKEAEERRLVTVKSLSQKKSKV
jgi:hypothetical protein